MLILVDAAQLLLFYPDRTATLWAWKLQPEMTAMVLGSVYIAGAYFFARLLFGAPWQRVEAGVPGDHRVRLAGGRGDDPARRSLHQGQPCRSRPGSRSTRSRRSACRCCTSTTAAAPAGRRARRCRATLRMALAAAGGALVVVALVFFAAPDVGDRRVAVDAHPADRPDHRRGDRAVRRRVAERGAERDMARRPDPAAGARARAAFVLLAVARGQDAIDWGNPLAVVFVAVAGVMLAVSAALAWAGP